MLEIGFNAGHSADTFLKSNSNIKLISFDINVRECVRVAKTYIDTTYPHRHTLILGDSKETIPEYAQQNPNTHFDIIFIDGGHSYDDAKNDLLNCKKLAHPNTIVIMDDVSNFYTSSTGWAEGSTTVWNEAKINNIINEIAHEDYAIGRGMSWGKYVFLEFK